MGDLDSCKSHGEWLITWRVADHMWGDGGVMRDTTKDVIGWRRWKNKAGLPEHRECASGAHNLSEVEGGTETGNGGTVDTDTDTDRKATTQRTE